MFVRVVLWFSVFLTVSSFSVQELEMSEYRIKSKLKSPQRCILEEIILSASNCLKEMLKNGDEQIGVPVIDPLLIDSFTIDFSELNRTDVIDGELTIQDFYGRGLSSWEFERLIEDIILEPIGYNLKITILLSKLAVSGRYNGTVQLFSTYDIYGDGAISFSIDDAELAITIDLGLAGGIHLSNFYISDVAIAYITGTITGLLNNENLSSLISDFISNELEYIFNENSERIARYIEKWVFEFEQHLETDGIQNGIVGAVVNKCLPLFV